MVKLYLYKLHLFNSREKLNHHKTTGTQLLHGCTVFFGFYLNPSGYHMPHMINFWNSDTASRVLIIWSFETLANAAPWSDFSRDNLRRIDSDTFGYIHQLWIITPKRFIYFRVIFERSGFTGDGAWNRAQMKYFSCMKTIVQNIIVKILLNVPKNRECDLSQRLNCRFNLDFGMLGCSKKRPKRIRVAPPSVPLSRKAIGRSKQPRPSPGGNRLLFLGEAVPIEDYIICLMKVNHEP